MDRSVLHTELQAALKQLHTAGITENDAATTLEATMVPLQQRILFAAQQAPDEPMSRLVLDELSALCRAGPPFDPLGHVPDVPMHLHV